MKLTLALVVVVNLVLSNAFVPGHFKLDLNLDEHWEQYKLLHNKVYESNEEAIRRQIWQENLEKVQKHNFEFDLGQHSYTLGINQFADLTHEEFKMQYLSFKRPVGFESETSTYLPPLNVNELPTTVDWRTQGYVTPVKDQKSCGSCWAFSATGALEGQYFRSHGHLLSFSEQQLVDCSRSFGNNGCNGGLMDSAFDYVKQYGIELESDYPYTARDGRCQYNAQKVQTKISSHVSIKPKNETDLMSAVATVGPISVAIDASHSSFQLYKSGVYTETRCSQTALDHGVLAIGYGSENGVNYWLVKNSWGPRWGDSGIIKMKKDQNNMCGIATMASYPVL